MLRWVASRERVEEVVGDLEEAHRKRVLARGRIVASLLTSLETVDMALTLMRDRIRRRNQAPIGHEQDRVFRADRKRLFSFLDVKLALRMLVKYPGLTVIGGLGITIAIAIGAGFFGMLSALGGDSLPLDEGDRIVALVNWDREWTREQDPRPSDFARWRTELTLITTLGVYRDVVHNVFSPDGAAEPIAMVEMTSSGFDLARVPPMLGRTLQVEDEIEGAPAVAVIGFDVWMDRFAGDPDVVGRDLRLGGTVHTVVGVMPEGFAFPINHRYWLPFRLDPRSYEPGEGPRVAVFGRLAPEATFASARAELEGVGLTMSADYPETHALLRPDLKPFAHQLIDGDSQQEMALIHLLIVSILVAVCANVAILVYARTATRAHELAVRTALGASRQRIVGQLFVEALVLSVGAAALGLLVAAKVLDISQTFQQGQGMLPFWIEFRITPGTAAYVLGLAALGAVIVGVLPGLQATARDVHTNLQRSGISRMQLGRWWTAMIVLQVAAAVTVLPPAVYVAWDFTYNGLADPGYDTEQFLSARLMLGESVVSSRRAVAYGHDTPETYAARQTALLDRLRAEPRVADVTYSLAVPGLEPTARLDVDDSPSGFVPTVGFARLGWVDIDFFEAFDVPVLAGRTFASADLDSGSVAVVVNESFVRSWLGGGNALGRLVRDAEIRPDTSSLVSRVGLVRDRWYEIVGVVSDFPDPTNPEFRPSRIYRPLAPGRAGPITVALRVRGNPVSFVPRFRELTVSVDPTLRLDLVRRLDLALTESSNMSLMAAIGMVVGMASLLLLSAAGIYALMSFTVTKRRREIGIRTALGADRRRLLLGVFRRAIVQLAVGVALGVAVVSGAEWYFSGEMLRGTGPVLVPAVAGLMVLVGVAAALGPAQRGLAIEPTEALREE